MPLPLLPLQILWMNLVTDGLPALALGVEPPERNAMKRPPYRLSESIFGQGMGWHIIWVGLLMAMVSLGMGYWAWRAGHEHWQSMVFTTLTLSQMGHVLAIRSDRESLFKRGLFSNMPLFIAVTTTTGLQLALLYTPVLQSIFKTMPLSPVELVISLGLSSMIFWAVELEKMLRRRRSPTSFGSAP
jgi:Ca2+-transporting ATPase